MYVPTTCTTLSKTSEFKIYTINVIFSSNSADIVFIFIPQPIGVGGSKFYL